MKASLFLLAVLSVLVACNDGAAIRKPTVGTNIHLGSISAGDILLHSDFFPKSPVKNAVLYQLLTYGGSNVHISYIGATEVGGAHRSKASILQGGVGLNNVTIRLKSARGHGYEYYVEIWGH